MSIQPEHIEFGDQSPRYLLVTPEQLRQIRAGGLNPAPVTNVNMVELKSQAEPSTPGFSQSHHEKDGFVEPPEHHEFPNAWVRIRHNMRDYFSEFLSTMILIIFGNGVNCQVILSRLTAGSYLSISFGWGIGVAMAVWVGGGISGAHINPVVTICLATFRGFPWKRVPGYILSQCLGAFVGAGLIFANYRYAIANFDGGVRSVTGSTATAGLFATYVTPFTPNVSAFFSEFLATAVLMIVLLAMSDKTNLPPPTGTSPIALLFLILGIGATLGWQTAYCLNPARDFGPRVMTAMVGYGRDVFTYRSHYWLWCPWLATICGGLAGSLTYDLLLFTGSESWVNRRFGSGKNKINAAFSA